MVQVVARDTPLPASEIADSPDEKSASADWEDLNVEELLDDTLTAHEVQNGSVYM